jgi:DNA-3-methyladenine glycosylase II
LAAGHILLGGRGASLALVRREPAFGPLYRRFGPAKVAGAEPLFRALVRAVAGQQLSVRAAATVFGRVAHACQGPVTPPAVQRIGEGGLRSCGLSRAKAKYVLGLAEAASSGGLDHERMAGMDDEEVMEALTALHGVGTWTAHMILIFTLHRPDVLPVGDLGIVDGARIVLGLDGRPTADALGRRAEAWRPYRSVASWYLWRERDRLVRRSGGLGP